MKALSAIRGAARSVRIYRLDRRHAAGLRRLYAPFVRRGDLVFDIGAHAGDRVAAFRALGARVVAVEPQRLLARLLAAERLLDRDATVLRCGVGARRGVARMQVNAANPTVSTFAEGFVAAAAGREGWRDQVWSGSADVEIETLDALIARFGRPSFVKIDVEGWEADVLAGLSHPAPALSFEVTTVDRTAALSALEQAARLGYRAFRISYGESHAFAGPWSGLAAMRARLASMPDAANSADVYCRL